jgi:hypothetical protein
MNDKQINYLRILNQQLNKGSITKKEFKKEVKFIKTIKTK